MHVSDNKEARLFLVFNEEQVSDLAFYFGVVPLAIVLLILYLVAWLAYRQSHRAVSPIVQLANLVSGFDFKNKTVNELDLGSLSKHADTEVLAMIKALQQFTQRLEKYIEREQQFTRNASHELRTPLAVIRGSVDLLLKSEQFNDQDVKAIHCIQRTAKDMESLVETLLMLAREENNKLPNQTLILNDLLQELAQTLQLIYSDKPIKMEVNNDSLLEINAPEKVLNILFTNLLRNAFNYTQQGQIRIIIKNKEVIIEDSGQGMSEAQVNSAFKPFYRASTESDGHGLWLAIVKRLCDCFAWEVKVSSAPNQGTAVTVTFQDAKVIGQRFSI